MNYCLGQERHIFNECQTHLFRHVVSLGDGSRRYSHGLVVVAPWIPPQLDNTI